MKALIILGIIISYLVIGGFATTNIIRLLKGETIKVSDGKCYCGSCGKVIPVYRQIPIFSYLLSRGKCKDCGTKIPKMSFYIEVSVFALTSVVSLLLSFSPLGVLMSFISYEVLKLCIIIYKGRKKEKFVKEYIISLLFSVFCFLLVAFMSAIYTYC